MLHCFHMKIITLNLTIYVINLSLCGQLPNQKKKRSPDVKAASTTANETRTFHLRFFNAQRVQRQHKYELNQRYIIFMFYPSKSNGICKIIYSECNELYENITEYTMKQYTMTFVLRNTIKQYTMTYSTTKHFIAHDKHYISPVAYILVFISLPLKMRFYGPLVERSQEMSRKLHSTVE